MPSERLWADGIDLDSLSTWIGLDSNRWSVPGPKGENIPVPARHGALYVNSKTFNEGTFTLQFHVKGDTAAKRSENTDRLLRTVTKRHKLIHFEHVREDGNRIECYAECVAPFDLSRAASQLPFEKFSCEFRVPAAFWQDQVQRSWQSPTALQEGQGLLMPPFAGGTAPMNDGIYLFRGPVDEPEIRVAGTGAFVRLQGVTVPAGQGWRVNAKTWTSTVGNVSFDGGGTSVIGKTVHGGSASFVDIPPFSTGAIALEVGGRNIGSAARIEALGRRKYLIGG